MNNKPLNWMKYMLYLFGLLTVALPAQAASFDCAKAGTKVEHLICNNPDISRLDENLATSYKAALLDQTKAEAIKQAQKQWMKERNSCTDMRCVKQAYEKRLDALKILITTSVPDIKQKKRFVVVEGAGVKICERYTKFLNSLPDEQAYPICAPKLSLAFPDLKEPDWEDMDISTHLELVYNIEKILSPSEHNRPVDTFDHWKSVYEQQLRDGKISPRLRRTHLALLLNSPPETILAYEPDRDVCERDIKTHGHSYTPMHTIHFLWDERNKKLIPTRISYIAFRGLIGRELLLYQGEPFTFAAYWRFPGSKASGEIDINYFTKVGAEPYASLSRCRIKFEMPRELYKRLAK